MELNLCTRPSRTMVGKSKRSNTTILITKTRLLVLSQEPQAGFLFAHLYLNLNLDHDLNLNLNPHPDRKSSLKRPRLRLGLRSGFGLISTRDNSGRELVHQSIKHDRWKSKRSMQIARAANASAHYAALGAG